MTQKEFTDRTGLTPNNDEFNFIHAVYMETSMDKDGTEKIFSSMPIKRNKYGYHVFIYSLFRSLPYTKNQRNKWAAHWSTNENDPLPEGAIILPRGSIKKLIGRELTWKDEPVELKE